MAECYCGHHHSRVEVAAASCGDECECNFKCTGNDRACGGRDRISVFEWEDDVPKEEPPPANDIVLGGEPKGCFVDDPNTRVLDGHSFESDDMTGEVCMD